MAGVQNQDVPFAHAAPPRFCGGASIREPVLPLLLRGGQFGVLWAKTPGTAPMNGTASAIAGRGRRVSGPVGTVPKTGTALPDAGRGAPRWRASLARPSLGGVWRACLARPPLGGVWHVP